MEFKNSRISRAASVMSLVALLLGIAPSASAQSYSSGDAAAGGIALLIMFFIWTALYFLPTIVALMRKHNVASILLLNLFLGWTVIGWIIALVMAFGQQAQATTIINQVHAPINPTYAPHPQPQPPAPTQQP